MANTPASDTPAPQDQTTSHGPKSMPIPVATTTGHNWDGITELNTPLPRWWLTILYASIIWAVGYWIVYPAWPMVSSFTTGVLGYSSRGDLAADQAKAAATRNAMAAGLETASLEEINSDPKLKELAVARGKSAFGDNCAACHGIGGQGGKGYPNLVDDDWLWGGTLADIHTTLEHGIRSATDPDTRLNIMQAYGRDGVLKPEEITAVANYVRSLSGLETEAGADLAAGKAVWEAQQCVSCHGENGAGMKEVGGPALNDKIWLYGGELETIRETLQNGRAGVMPNWAGRLDAVTVKSLAIYVHQLGGGQ